MLQFCDSFTKRYGLFAYSLPMYTFRATLEDTSGTSGGGGGGDGEGGGGDGGGDEGGAGGKEGAGVNVRKRKPVSMTPRCVGTAAVS